MAQKKKGLIQFKINWRYALGEIAIVAIGIMLAFQLNGWKERNNNEHLEQRSIKMLLSEVEKDSAIFYQYFKQANLHKQDALVLLQMLNSDDPNAHFDSISNCFRRCGFYSGSVLHRSAFQMMTAQGTLNLIKNDTLQKEIYSYYDHTHRVVELWVDFEKKMVDEVVPKLYQNGTVDDLQVTKTSGLRIFYKQKAFLEELLKDDNRGRLAVYLRTQNDLINVTNHNRRKNKALLKKLRSYVLAL